MLKLLKAIIIPITLLGMALLPFRNLLNNLYVGEPFDARLMIVVHEHWFWVFQGLRKYNDLGIFYPFQNTLGFTDGFLIEGFIHSIFRSLKFSIIQSYNLTNIFILFLSNIGMYLILSEIIKKKYLVLVLIFLISNGYSLLAYLHLWPNILGYLLISWPIYFFIRIYQIKHVNIYFSLLLVFMPVYALSYWYPTFFLILSLFVICLSALLFRNLRFNFITWLRLSNKAINFKAFILVSPLWISAWLFFFKIYIQNSLNVRRDITEILYGPTIQDVFSTKLLGGSYFQPIYEFLKLDQPKDMNYKFIDWLVGFSPLMFLIFIVLTLLKKKTSLDKYLIYFILIVFITFTNFNGYGVYVYLYNQFEILRVIRVPSRFNLYITIAMLLIIFRYLDSKITKQNRLSLFLLFIPLLLVIDNLRIAPGRWSNQDFINANLLNFKSKIIDSCEYFSVTNPGAGHWSDTMDAMVLSVITNVPTLNGYSGTSPSDGIQRLWTDPSEVQEVKNYVQRQKLDNSGCIVSNDGVTKINFLMPNNIFSDSMNLLWEKDSRSYWVWQEEPETNFMLNTDKLIDRNFEFIIEAPICIKGSYILTLSNKNWVKEYDLNDASKIYVRGKDFQKDNSIKINTNFAGCYVDNDPRQLFYKIVLPRA